MPPKSNSTLKRKRGKNPGTESEKGGAILASSAFTQPLWSTEEKHKFKAEVRAEAVLMTCRAALVKSPEASRAALLKYRASLDSGLVKMLETVGAYECEDFSTPLHESVVSGDAVTTQYLIAAGGDLDVKNWDRKLPEYLVDDDDCREVFEKHVAILDTLGANPAALVSAAAAHCESLAAPGAPLPETAFSLGAYQLDMSFLWAPPAARAAITDWARDVIIAQLAATVPFLEELSDDCAGDVLEFLMLTVTRSELPHLSAIHSSPEAHAWVRAVVVAAVAAANQAEARIELVPAAERCDLTTVQALVAKGIDVDLRDKSEHTALMMAAAAGKTAVATFLLQAGANVHLEDKEHNTALIYAASNGHIAIVRLLLKSGAELEHDGEDGWTAFICASFCGHTDIVKLLLKEGADVDAEGEVGDTALMMASREGHAGVVKVLLGAGADKDLEDESGQTAMDLAEEANQSEVLALLRA